MDLEHLKKRAEKAGYEAGQKYKKGWV